MGPGGDQSEFNLSSIGPWQSSMGVPPRSAKIHQGPPRSIQDPPKIPPKVHQDQPRSTKIHPSSTKIHQDPPRSIQDLSRSTQDPLKIHSRSNIFMYFRIFSCIFIQDPSKIHSRSIQDPLKIHSRSTQDLFKIHSRSTSYIHVYAPRHTYDHAREYIATLMDMALSIKLGLEQFDIPH